MSRGLPDIRPLGFQKSPTIVWKSFEYYSPLKKILDHVGEHPDQALSLAQAARIASLEYTHFASYFRKRTGVTFKCWIDFMRICRAVQILQSLDKPITEVAHDSGFGDPTTFARTFRRVVGITPSQYRARRRPSRHSIAFFRIESKESPKESKESPKNTQESPRL